MLRCGLLVSLVLALLPHGARAAECKDSAVVVVVSVFVTLAVVFIVLGIVGFLIWKRRRDISRPEKLKNDQGSSPTSSPDGRQGYNNPAFDRDPELGDADVPGYVPCKDKVSEKSKDDEIDLARLSLEERPKSLTDNDMAKKTWSSLPGSDLPFSGARSRKASTGSLDGGNYPQEESMVEVWLTSQDFIGLGFNIAGSMRDGIYVSQVHNRGPATESGQFKVGDRIMSVAISFENMVYEDALTILSYASPYPVKVTLQKEQKMPKNRRLSEVRTPLNHPLYRSQSVDAVNVVPKESLPVFNPKRAASEMRYDRRNSPKAVRTSKAGTENDIMEENNFSPGKDEVFHKNVPIHRRKSDKDKINFDREMSVPIETDLPVASVELTTDEKKAANGDVRDSSNSQFNEVFEHLTEQDKLDMLRLSYDDPDAMLNKSNEVQKQVVEAEINHQAIHADLRSAPIKPERKKKRSSTNSTPSHSDGDSSMSSPRLTQDNSFSEEILALPTEAPPPIPDDVFDTPFAPPREPPPPLPQEFISAELHAPTEAAPPVPDSDNEANEDMILPCTKQREVTVNSNTIVFSPMTGVGLDVSDVSIDRTVVGDASFSDTSFSDLDKTLVSPDSTRPESPDGDGIEEDEICATQVKKDQILQQGIDTILSKSLDVPLVPNGITKTKDSGEKNIDNKNNENSKKETGSRESVQTSDDDFEKDLPKLDMNLNFDTFGSDSVLFQESFPNRNERGNDSGVAFDISVVELESMERKFREDQRSKSENQIGKGGIAFEIRDDMESGNTRTVNTNSVHRTVSCDLQSPTDFFAANEISSQRPTSLKGDFKRRDELETGVLDWSGKRLVRSGSFTEIPQDDSVKDWTDEQRLNEDDALIEKHIAEDAKSPVLKTLTRATMLQSNQKMEDLSDSDSQCRSFSSHSSSRSDSPKHLDNFDGTNGEDDGLGMSPDNSPVKITPTSDMKSELITDVAKYGESEQSFTVTLNTTEDEDC